MHDLFKSVNLIIYFIVMLVLSAPCTVVQVHGARFVDAPSARGGRGGFICFRALFRTSRDISIVSKVDTVQHVQNSLVVKPFTVITMARLKSHVAFITLEDKSEMKG